MVSTNPSPTFGRRLEGLELTAEDQKQVQAIQRDRAFWNRRNPHLRFEMPLSPHLGHQPNYKLCDRKYREYQSIRTQEDAAAQAAVFLARFQEQHPREWECSGWKSDAIAELVLGRLGYGTSAERRRPAEDWFKQYWRVQQRFERRLEAEVSPRGQAVAQAVAELGFLKVFRQEACAAFVRWLDKNWARMDARASTDGVKKPPLNELTRRAVGAYRARYPKASLSDSFLGELCRTYVAIEPRYKGKVPPSAVLLELVAKRHRVSARKISSVEAETGRLFRKSGHQKAR